MQNIIKKILKEKDIDNLDPETRRELKRYLVQLDQKQKHTKIQTDFMAFVKQKINCKYATKAYQI